VLWLRDESQAPRGDGAETFLFAGNVVSDGYRG
jgi:hypothetical protein